MEDGLRESGPVRDVSGTSSSLDLRVYHLSDTSSPSLPLPVGDPPPPSY